MCGMMVSGRRGRVHLMEEGFEWFRLSARRCFLSHLLTQIYIFLRVKQGSQSHIAAPRQSTPRRKDHRWTECVRAVCPTWEVAPCVTNVFSVPRGVLYRGKRGKARLRGRLFTDWGVEHSREMPAAMCSGQDVRDWRQPKRLSNLV